MKPWIGQAEAQAAAQTVLSGWIAQGPRVAEFEQALATRLQAAHGVAVSSCTTALHLVLVQLGVGPKDEVVVPSLSFIATANAVRYVGATPVFADVDPTTQNLTPETISQVLSPRTRAVILVHQAGVPADIDAVHALCSSAGIAVVEDAACAIGSTYQKRPIGCHSSLVALSFHPRKLLTTGEGGMVLTSDSSAAERLRRLRDHGSSASATTRHSAAHVMIEQYLELGFNYRMTDIQAAVGLAQLPRLDAMVAERRRLASLYQTALADLEGVRFVCDPPYGTTNYQAFWIELPDSTVVHRDDVLESLLEEGVSARRGIMAAHLEPAYAGHAHTALPVTERLTHRTIILPLHYELGEAGVARVVAALRHALFR
jgi:dTDP-4-amino-4,6-dideoxygalactose transaminase